MESVPLDIDDEIRITTARSIWFVRPETYLRMPRREEPRHVPAPEIVDAVWHHHTAAWLVTDDIGSYIRLLPAGRPASAGGVATGAILACDPPLERLRRK